MGQGFFVSWFCTYSATTMHLFAGFRAKTSGLALVLDWEAGARNIGILTQCLSISTNLYQQELREIIGLGKSTVKTTALSAEKVRHCEGRSYGQQVSQRILIKLML